MENAKLGPIGSKSATSKLSPLFLGGAALIGAYFTVQAVMSLMEPSRLFTSPNPEVTNALAPSSSASNRAQGVAIDPNFDAFHRLAPLEAIAEVITEIGDDAPETKLQLVLKGRRSAADGSGSATLLLPDRSQKTFQTGEEILRNVTLKAVYPSHIIISQRGKLERLTFERDESLLGQAPSESPRTLEATISSGVVGNQIGNNQPRPRPIPRSVPRSNLGSGQTNSNSAQIDVNSALASLGQSPTQFLRNIRPTPVRKNGQLFGYRVNGSQNAKALAEFGLKPNDVITQINGESLGSISDIRGIMSRAESDPASMSITVDRGGQTITISGR